MHYDEVRGDVLTDLSWTQNKSLHCTDEIMKKHVILRW